MKTKVLWALVALNVLLLVGWIAPLGRSAAQAQVGQPKVAHAGDEFLMISGEIIGGNSAVVYVIDETQNMMTARTFDEMGRNKQLVDMAPIDLDRIFQPPGGAAAAAGGGGGR